MKRTPIPKSVIGSAVWAVEYAVKLIDAADEAIRARDKAMRHASEWLYGEIAETYPDLVAQVRKEIEAKMRAFEKRNPGPSPMRKHVNSVGSRRPSPTRNRLTDR